MREVAAELVLEPLVRARPVVRDDAGAVRKQERRAPAQFQMQGFHWAIK